MKTTSAVSLALVAVISVSIVAAGGDAQDKQAPTVKIPQPGVPQIMTLEGQYIRAAYNNEGYVILGYRVANSSLGEEWIFSSSAAPCVTGYRTTP
jgi:hypothetical protein